MSNIFQIAAKTGKVIESCTTKAQFKVAKQYYEQALFLINSNSNYTPTSRELLEQQLKLVYNKVAVHLGILRGATPPKEE